MSQYILTKLIVGFDVDHDSNANVLANIIKSNISTNQVKLSLYYWNTLEVLEISEYLHIFIYVFIEYTYVFMYYKYKYNTYINHLW